MSGSDRDTGGYVGSAAEEPCEKLHLTRFLESPIDAAVATLNVGDVLSVVLRDDSPPLVLAVTAGGDEAGGILPTGQLIECLRRGVPFAARVIRMNDGAVELDVRAAT